MACTSYIFPCYNHILHRNNRLDEILTSVSQGHVIGKGSVAADEDGRIQMRKDGPCGYDMGLRAFLAYFRPQPMHLYGVWLYVRYTVKQNYHERPNVWSGYRRCCNFLCLGDDCERHSIQTSIQIYKCGSVGHPNETYIGR